MSDTYAGFSKNYDLNEERRYCISFIWHK